MWLISLKIQYDLNYLKIKYNLKCITYFLCSIFSLTTFKPKLGFYFHEFLLQPKTNSRNIYKKSEIVLGKVLSKNKNGIQFESSTYLKKKKYIKKERSIYVLLLKLNQKYLFFDRKPFFF